MLNLRKRIKELQDRTSSEQARTLTKEVLENCAGMPEAQLSIALTQKLKTIQDSDRAVDKFIQVSEKIEAITDLGIMDSIQAIKSSAIAGDIKESQIYNYPALKYGLGKIEMALSSGTPEYMIIDSMLECIKTFTWEPTMKAMFENLHNKRTELNEDILVAQNILIFKNMKGSFVYEGIVAKLEEHFSNPTETSRSVIMEDLKNFNFAPAARMLSENLAKIQRSKKGGIQIIADNSNCEIYSIYSPVLLENGSEYFFTRGTYFAKKDGKIRIVLNEEVKSLPEKFKDLCRIISAPNVAVKEGKISFYLDRNKVEILENKDNKIDVLYNGSSVSISQLAKNMVSAGLFRVDEAKVAYDVQLIAESFENIYDLDFGKIIESTKYRGSYVILMKTEEGVYLNKVNESMKSNEFFSGLNTKQARAQVIEFIGFDIKESMQEYLDKDDIKLKELSDSRAKILSNIAVVENNLDLVEESMKDSFVAESVELKDVKKMLEDELAKLKAAHKQLTAQIQNFESASISDAGYVIGDEVKINETGESATVSSIDSVRDTVFVITSKGHTLELPVDKISSLENEISNAEEKNAEAPKEIQQAEPAVAENNETPTEEPVIVEGAEEPVSTEIIATDDTDDSKKKV